MTFPALQGRSDPRVLCGILADQFVTEVSPAQQLDDDATICLVNLMRLLDMYRHEVMQSIPEPTGILEREPVEFVDWIDPQDDPLQHLDAAMSFAQSQAFPADTSRTAAATSIQTVLRLKLAGKTVPADQSQQTQKFFEVLIDKLRAQH